ncbi:MAG: thiamine-monophosphate kinase [Actinomycetota bacterium]
MPAIGDDAAVLPDGLLASVDTLVVGVDWRDDWSSPADVGWKSIMVNASDIAAMGGRSRWFLVSLVVADGFDVDAFYDGAIEACEALGAEVVGGDLSSGGQTVISVTALGHADEPILRSGAQAGDGVWVSGPLGAAARDLRVLRATEPIDFGRTADPRPSAMRPKSAGGPGSGGGAAHARPTAYMGPPPVGATALIDVSDGLVADCAHIARSSGVQIALESVPLADGATLDEALHGGDDYVLVACAPDAIDGWTRIGTCVAGSGVTVDGSLVEPRGWEHQL